MPRKTVSKTPPTRKRRTGEEARAAILGAAERLLIEVGPSGIRLQELAADVGVSHPTLLHHFGSRQGLIEAVVARALDSLHADLLAAVKAAPQGPDEVAALLDRVFDTLVHGGHARAVLWLALEGYGQAIDPLRLRGLSEAVHEIRKVRRKERGIPGRVPPAEDTYFTVLVPALSLLSMAAMNQSDSSEAAAEQALEARRFRAWLARIIHKHLEEG
jgi:AcrR family transcriptional regulator